MHMPRIFFKSSMIPASYAFPVVLICNTRVYACAGMYGKTCHMPQNGTETALESLKGLFPYRDIPFPFSWLISPILSHFGACGAFHRQQKSPLGKIPKGLCLANCLF